MFVALDGVIEDPRWSLQFVEEGRAKYKYEELFAHDALLLGRKTYEGFAASWPNMEAETGEYGKRMNSMPKYVVSTTLEKPEWNASVIKGGSDLKEEVLKLKHQPGQDLLIFGSSTLVHALTQLDLIDEYRLMVFPVAVGKGQRFFPETGNEKVFKLVDSKIFEEGVIVLTYEPKRE
jgi:dihydrofolate reductase